MNIPVQAGKMRRARVSWVIFLLEIYLLLIPFLVYEIASYLPDFALDYYDQLKDSLLSFLEKIRVIPAAEKTSGTTSPHNLRTCIDVIIIADSSRARQAFNNAENALKKLENEKKVAEKDISKIFDVESFGTEGEWKKLDGTCLEYDDGEYIYETCLFKEAKQKPKNGGTTYSLG
jgi:protein kinase C substrate 80K-H